MGLLDQYVKLQQVDYNVFVFVLFFVLFFCFVLFCFSLSICFIILYLEWNFIYNLNTYNDSSWRITISAGGNEALLGVYYGKVSFAIQRLEKVQTSESKTGFKNGRYQSYLQLGSSKTYIYPILPWERRTVRLEILPQVPGNNKNLD